ncbi:MAG: MarR family transcriptional regulator [Alphaproteobacteria bacterium]|nr:MarR family transcriptional regulator [Alphaproteobacteria bacterium]
MGRTGRSGIRSTEELRYAPLGELLGYGLRRAQLRAFQDFAETMAPFDISPGQLGGLLLVDTNSGLNQSALARAMGLDRSTIVAVIDNLETRGLIRRRPAPGDRRAHALFLTDAGRRFLRRIEPHLRAHEDRLSAGLSTDERRTLTDLLKRINGL